MDETSGREKENEHKMVESNVQWRKQNGCGNGEAKVDKRPLNTTTILTQSMPPLITSLQQMNERAFRVYTVHFHSKFDIKQAMKKWHCFTFSKFATLQRWFFNETKIVGGCSNVDTTRDAMTEIVPLLSNLNFTPSLLISNEWHFCNECKSSYVCV